MNRDSRKHGKGTKPPKKRVVTTRASTVSKLPVEPDKLLALQREFEEKPEKLDLKTVREMCLQELATHALDAARAFGQSAKSRKQRARRSGQADAATRWMLEQLFARADEQGGGQEATAEQGSQGPSSESVADLAEQRRELRLHIISQRRALNK